MLGIVKICDTRQEAHRNNKFAFLIAVATGEKIFFHESDCITDFTQLTPGEAVSFELKDYRDNRTGAARRKAIKVTPTDPKAVLDALRPPRIEGQPVPSAKWQPPQTARAFQDISLDVITANLVEQ